MVYTAVWGWHLQSDIGGDLPGSGRGGGAGALNIERRKLSFFQFLETLEDWSLLVIHFSYIGGLWPLINRCVCTLAAVSKFTVNHFKLVHFHRLWGFFKSLWPFTDQWPQQRSARLCLQLVFASGSVSVGFDFDPSSLPPSIRASSSPCPPAIMARSPVASPTHPVSEQTVRGSN